MSVYDTVNVEYYSSKDEEHTFRPIVLNQLKKVEHSLGVYKLDSQPLFVFKIVGRLLSIHTSPYNITYTIEDGTGSASFVFKWAKFENYSMHNAIEPDSYVRLYCRCITNFNVGLSIAPVDDFNELSYHQIEVIYHHFKLDR